VSELSTAEVLRRARKVIEDPERWTQGAYSRDGGKRCAAGAIYCQDAPVDDRAVAYSVLWAVVGSRVEGFNDSHSHTEVLAAFDKAIAEAEKA
jgi:hypothetical protein